MELLLGLASGSLSRFWNIEEINHGETYTIPELVDIDLRKRLSFYEKNRINYKCDLVPKSLKEVSAWIISFPGPRLIIANTVQNAAIITDFFNKKYGKSKVEHLSTALTPFDRDKTVDRIKERLNDKSDANWTLIATSCVEAGIDVSFRTGFRELSSLLSLLQTAGRVNRGGIYDNSEIWTFKLKETDNFNSNPELQISRTILQKYFEKDIDITPELSTESIDEEIKERGASLTFKKILAHEKSQRFPKVEEMFKVINTDTKLVITNREIINDIKSHNRVSWQDIQKHSVRIYGYNLEKYAVEEFLPDMYKWTLDYDDFLGIMAGALIVIKTIKGEGLIA